MSIQLNKLYSDLQDIMLVKKFNLLADQECFQEIGNVLDKYNRIDKYLITLLHTHFDIYADEILLEHLADDKRMVVKTPVKSALNQIKMDLTPTSWRFYNADKKGQLKVINRFDVIEYSTGDEARQLYCFDDEDQQCFFEISQILQRFNNLNRFGLALNYENLNLEKGEVSLEITDIDSRELIIEPEEECKLNKSLSIPTSWKLNRKIVKLMGRCETNYRTWCDAYCKESSWCKSKIFEEHSDVRDHKGAYHKERKESYHRIKSRIEA